MQHDLWDARTTLHPEEEHHSLQSNGVEGASSPVAPHHAGDSSLHGGHEGMLQKDVGPMDAFQEGSVVARTAHNGAMHATATRAA